MGSSSALSAMVVEQDSAGAVQTLVLNTPLVVNSPVILKGDLTVSMGRFCVESC